MDHLAPLCRETWGEEQWRDAVKDLPHGRVRREGPAAQGATKPFGFQRSPLSARRTHVMYAARAGDVARLTWLLARGAQLELKHWEGRTALFLAAREGCMGTVRKAACTGRGGGRSKECRRQASVHRQPNGQVGHFKIAR